ncbi:hypothetical protein [Spirosoma sp.]|uniref:hypothetical protein n=1 Tax=Spirosoma sp. TaxID=1899569 RepID=UPI003B3BAEE1
MDIILRLIKTVAVFGIPLLITSIPLVVFLFLSQLERIKESSGLIFLTTVFSTFIGWWTPFLGMLICSYFLASSMPDDKPKCVTGAVLFLFLGYLITGATLLIGLGTSVQQLLKRANAYD